MTVRPIVQGVVRGIVQGISGGNGGANPLVFHALDDVDGSFVADVITGVGSITEARTSTNYAPNASGVWTAYTSGQPIQEYAGGKWWVKGEPAHTNSLPYSKPDTTNWSLTEGSAGALGTNMDFQTGDGTGWAFGTGWSVVDSGGGAYVARHATGVGFGNLTQAGILESGKIYKITYTLSNYSGTATFRVQAGGTNGTIRSSNGTYTEYLQCGASTSLIIGAGEDAGGDIDNVIVQPCVIESYTTGLTGAADSAVVLTDDDGAVSERVLYTSTIPNDTNPVTNRVFVAKDNDETRFVGIIIGRGTGAGAYDLHHLNTKTGATSAEASSLSSVIEVRDTGGGFWEVITTWNNTSQTAGIFGIYPSRGTVFGTPSTAATGSVTISDPVELHLNTTIAAVRGSSPIMTDGSAASTVASNITADGANGDKDHAVYCEYMQYSDFAGISAMGGDATLVGPPGAGNRELGVLNGQLATSSYDAGSVSGPSITETAETTYKCAVIKHSDVGKIKVCVDGVYGTEATDFSDVKAEFTVMEVGNYGSSVAKYPYLIRNVRRYQAPYETQQTIIDGLMS